MRIGPGGPSATIEASGTPGTSPACLEDSQERTRPGREGGWPGAGGCVGGSYREEGTSLLLGLWVQSEGCPKGLGLARATQALAGSGPEPHTWGCSVHPNVAALFWDQSQSPRLPGEECVFRDEGPSAQLRLCG